jgi:hypothetical protein
VYLGGFMAEKKMYYMCCTNGCRAICEVSGDDVTNKLKDNKAIYLCPKCNEINVIKTYEDEWSFKEDEIPKGCKRENYLGCLNYNGPMNRTAVGLINDGTPMYADVYGRKFTRKQFMDKYKTDPAGHILERIKQQEVFDKFEELKKASRKWP